MLLTYLVPTLAKWRKIGGLGAEPPAANRFKRFSHKNTHLSTIFIEKGRTVPAVNAVSNRQYKNILVDLPLSILVYILLGLMQSLIDKTKYFSRKGAIHALFTLRRMQEEFRGREKKSCTCVLWTWKRHLMEYQEK